MARRAALTSILKFFRLAVNRGETRNDYSTHLYYCHSAVVPQSLGPANPGSNQKPKPAQPGKPGRCTDFVRHGPGNPGSGQKPPNRPPPGPKRSPPRSSPIRTRDTCFYHEGLAFCDASFWLMLAILLQSLGQYLRILDIQGVFGSETRLQPCSPRREFGAYKQSGHLAKHPVSCL